jgi:DNA-binding response OmpR family regulator
MTTQTAHMKILLAEDDPVLARQACTWFKQAGHSADWADKGKSALHHGHNECYDVIVLDLGLPEIDGLTVLRQLRADAVRTPVLCLTARDTVNDRVLGLRTGADDYLTKPFAEPELIARVEALHRRSNGVTTPALKPGWKLDVAKRRVQVNGMTADLQPREWALLENFMANEGTVLTKKFLLANVWDLHFDPGTNVVDVMICRLRRKIDLPERPSHIQTVRGKGYVFKAAV